MSEYATITNGLFTCDNKRFLRLWFEVSCHNINFKCKSKDDNLLSSRKWYPYNKGGEFRRWYGNQEYVVNFLNFGKEISEYRVESGQSAAFPGQDYYFCESISWSLVSPSKFGIRYYPSGFVFDIAGSSTFPMNKENTFYILAYLASELVFQLLRISNPTINYQAGNIRTLPLILDESKKVIIDKYAQENIQLSKSDWDSFETSWNFIKHPLIRDTATIKEAFEQWKQECDNRFNKLKANEEELNRIFIDIYGLQDELTPEVDEKDVTVRRADLQRDVKSLISYGVGCILGRYSLDCDGLAYAGGTWDDEKYEKFKPVKTGFIPIYDFIDSSEIPDEDLCNRFVEFIKTVYGKSTLEENLRFIADVLGGKGTSRDVIRNYFLNDFYADHCADYSVTGSGKRPIYWLFDSGKKNGFKCFMYLHRYSPQTLSDMYRNYIVICMNKYKEKKDSLEKSVESSSGSAHAKYAKQLEIVKAQLIEIEDYADKVYAFDEIDIDLDDGVKHNYELFKGLLAKIK